MNIPNLSDYFFRLMEKYMAKKGAGFPTLDRRVYQSINDLQNAKSNPTPLVATRLVIDMVSKCKDSAALTKLFEDHSKAYGLEVSANSTPDLGWHAHKVLQHVYDQKNLDNLHAEERIHRALVGKQWIELVPEADGSECYSFGWFKSEGEHLVYQGYKYPKFPTEMNAIPSLHYLYRWDSTEVTVHSRNRILLYRFRRTPNSQLDRVERDQYEGEGTGDITLGYQGNTVVPNQARYTDYGPNPSTADRVAMVPLEDFLKQKIAKVQRSKNNPDLERNFNYAKLIQQCQNDHYFSAWYLLWRIAKLAS